MKVVPAGEIELRKWAVEQAGGDLEQAQKIYEFAAGVKAVQQVTIDLKFDTSAVERLMEDLKKPGIVEPAEPAPDIVAGTASEAGAKGATSFFGENWLRGLPAQATVKPP